MNFIAWERCNNLVHSWLINPIDCWKHSVYSERCWCI